MPYTIWEHITEAEKKRLKAVMPRTWNPELEELEEIERLIRKPPKVTKGGK